jgi:tetratricopeptide (TPR) repeat protein
VTAINRVQSQRLLREAEGYLELGLPQSALDCLARMRDPGTFLGRQLYLRGEALRTLKRFSEASDSLKQATDLIPSEIPVWLALGWCLKRSGRLGDAISALEHARDVDPGEAIVHYNLACYQSLAGQKHEAIANLMRAIDMKPDFRDMVNDESDFDPIRSDPDFQAITSAIV